MESDATRMCELLIGLPDVTVLGIVDEPGPLVVHVESAGLFGACLGLPGAWPCTSSCEGHARRLAVLRAADTVGVASINPPDRPIATQLRCHCLRRTPVV